MLIFLLVQEEWSYDRYHKKKDQIYRVVVREHRTDGQIKFSVLQPFELAQAFEQSMPGVVHATGYMRAQGNVTYGEKTSWRTFGLIDPAYLHMFTIPIIAGDLNTALNDPNAVIISQATAKRYFDNIAPDYSNLLGRTLTFHGASNPQDFVISGIMKNVPRTSSMRMDLLVNNENYQNFHRSDDWGGHTSIYIELAHNQTITNITKTLPAFTQEHARKRIQEFRKEGRIIDSDEGYQLHLQPLTDVYQNTTIRNTYESRGNIQNVYILATIAFVILTLACINFTTLSIGRSTSRALEVGMRKVLGAHRSQLMKQFWGEAILRKVLGANVPNLVSLLSKDFAKLLLIANILGWPLAYWAMNQWLAEFAYRIELSPFVFIAAGALTFIIALTTICAQTLKAARANPIDALRYE